MIVDLMRNDLGRVCAPGCVRVPAIVRPERHAVLASGLRRRRPRRLMASPTRRCCARRSRRARSPARRRCVRWRSSTPSRRPAARPTPARSGTSVPPTGLELNVAIRTFEFAGGRIWLGVGGGIVADSTPEGEYAECWSRPSRWSPRSVGVLDAELDAAGRRRAAAARSARRARRARSTCRSGVFTTLLVLDGDTGRPRGARRPARRKRPRGLRHDGPGRTRRSGPAQGGEPDRVAIACGSMRCPATTASR